MRLPLDTLPSLPDIQIASPCSVSWDGMAGNDQVRFCGQCCQNVYDLSAMSYEDASRFIEESAGQHCLRFYRRADGTI